MQTERFGYFRFKNGGRVHYLEQLERGSMFRSLCGKAQAKAELIPANAAETEKDLCKSCKRVEDTVFWGWEQMI